MCVGAGMKMYRSALVAFLSTCWCAWGEAATHENVLVKYGPQVDRTVVETVKTTIESQLGLTCNLLVTNQQARTLEGSIAAAEKSASLSGDIVVVLINSSGTTNFTSAVFRSSRVLLINAVDQPGRAGENTSRASFARIVQREVVQGFGALVGLNPCPNPLCAMCVRVQSHDARQAVGFCPICTSSFRKHLKAMGYKHRYDRLAEEAAGKGMMTNRPASTPAVTLPPEPAPSPSK